MFCQVEVLRHSFPSSVRQILEELPDSLDETYERILREIRKPKQGHAHRLLQCLVAAVRPLRVEELAEVLAFDFNTDGIPKLNLGWRWDDQEAAVLSACSSLVIIVQDRDSRIVQFSHFSVKEFLTANRLAEPIRDVTRYHIQLAAAHTILAQACLGLLLRLDDRVDCDSIENFPLARYAAEYWATHARYDDGSSRIKDGMECLFDSDKPHFATWLWIYNEDVYGQSMATMCPEKPDAVPLYYAAALGFCHLAKHLIAKNAEQVNVMGGNWATSMHVAARAGHVDILSLLLENGAKVDIRGFRGYTPLHRASENRKLEAGRCLLEHGADVNARTHRGDTPLHRAVSSGSVQNVRLLLEHGADVNVRDKSGETPFQLGSRLGNHEVVELLSEYRTKSVK